MHVKTNLKIMLIPVWTLAFKVSAGSADSPFGVWNQPGDQLLDDRCTIELRRPCHHTYKAKTIDEWKGISMVNIAMLTAY